jgi:Flp pilus assembly protein TadG
MRSVSTARGVRNRAAMRGWRDERGAAAVEFGLIFPLIVLILFGIIEFGRAWNVRQTLTDAAREGARVAVVAERANLSSAQLADSVARVVRRAAARASLDSTKLVIEANASTGVGGVSGSQARVSLTYEHAPLAGTLIISSPSLTMRSAVVMRNE